MRALRAVVKGVRRSYRPPRRTQKLKPIVGPAICMYAIHKVLALTSNGAKRSDNFFNSYNFSGGLRPLNSYLSLQK